MKNKIAKMADKISREKRSSNMSKIKGKDTLLEKTFRKRLYASGIRYRLNYPLYGKPDLVIPSKRTAVFINGCFWHQHSNCKLSYMPKSNIDFWKKKLESNIERDRKVISKLEEDGWKVIRVWECDIEERLGKTVPSVAERINHL